MSAVWSRDDMAELRHHMRMLWISYDPAGIGRDDTYDAYVEEALKLCIDKAPQGELVAFVDYVTYKKLAMDRTADRDEANAFFAKKVTKWYRDCELLFGSVE